MFMKPSILATAIATCLVAQSASAASPTNEEMWELIKKQQQQIEALKNRLNVTDEKVEVTEQKVEATGEMLEERSGSASSSWVERTRIGGYGELKYHNWSNQKEGGSDKKDMDSHRFVLFFSHQFNDRIRFFSEFELEHGLSKDTDDGSGPGEVELEQMYVDFDLNENHTARAGVFLMPIGFLNETHEPNTFYGVDRSPVEKNIIPTTWWEGGAGAHGELMPGLNYDVSLTSGLKVPTSGSNAFLIRKGRQKVAKATAEAPAFTGALSWTGIAGLELGGAIQYQSDLTQSANDNEVSALLLEAHASWQSGPFGLKALYARWDLDSDDAKAIGRDEQMGWYIEPSYKISVGEHNLGFFARYALWDNEAGNSASTEYKQVNVGVNYWPHEDVVLKFDYQNQSSPDGKNEYDGFNLGFGYQF